VFHRPADEGVAYLSGAQADREIGAADGVETFDAREINASWSS